MHVRPPRTLTYIKGSAGNATDVVISLHDCNSSERVFFSFDLPDKLSFGLVSISVLTP